jgi:hypothetical protein
MTGALAITPKIEAHLRTIAPGIVDEMIADGEIVVIKEMCGKNEGDSSNTR